MITYLARTFPNLQRWAYNASGFNQYGLRRDDLFDEGHEDVVEALRRLPPYLMEERNFRLIRALQLSCQRKILPKEEWTKLEEDDHYLLPYLEEVRKERKEREEWESQ